MVLLLLITNLNGLPLTGLDNHHDDLSQEMTDDEYLYDLDTYDLIIASDNAGNFDTISDETLAEKFNSGYIDLSDENNKISITKKTTIKPKNSIILVKKSNEMKPIKTTSKRFTIINIFILFP